jgi:hypothetical protein
MERRNKELKVKEKDKNKVIDVVSDKIYKKM